MNCLSLLNGSSRLTNFKCQFVAKPEPLCAIMLRLLSILFLFCSIKTCAQSSLDFGLVKQDTTFNCKENNQVDSTDFGVTSLCDSKNEFEFRLKTFIMPRLDYGLIILSYDNLRWNIKKYEVKLGVMGSKIIKISFDTRQDSVSNLTLRILFDSLKKNNAFALPSQYELKIHNSRVCDGVYYELAFKINNIIGHYNFDNPASYLEHNSDIAELKEYASIVKNLESLFY